jgi:hypothetical protein
MQTADSAAGAPLSRRRRVLRSALLFGAIAVSFYLGFIVLMVLRGR